MTNAQLKHLITEMKKLDKPLWKRVASDLEKPSRQRRIVNLSRINRYAKENETIIVPGKVLGSGLLDHKLTIAAFCFSGSAIEKIRQSKGKAVKLGDFITEPVKGKRVRIIG